MSETARRRMLAWQDVHFLTARSFLIGKMCCPHDERATRSDVNKRGGAAREGCPAPRLPGKLTLQLAMGKLDACRASITSPENEPKPSKSHYSCCDLGTAQNDRRR
jgi:hypothetical protein